MIHRAFDSPKFRQVLGHFPTGVTAVCTQVDDVPSGLAVGSFASVSLDPPLVMFCPSKSSTTWPAIEKSGVFCVNVLSDDQEEISRIFASKDEDKFHGLGWREAPTGSPILDGVLAYIDCEVDQVIEAGDHWIVIGRVVDLDVLHEGHPLVFFRGGYGRFEV